MLGKYKTDFNGLKSWTKINLCQVNCCDQKFLSLNKNIFALSLGSEFDFDMHISEID